MVKGTAFYGNMFLVKAPDLNALLNGELDLKGECNPIKNELTLQAPVGFF